MEKQTKMESWRECTLRDICPVSPRWPPCSLILRLFSLLLWPPAVRRLLSLVRRRKGGGRRQRDGWIGSFFLARFTLRLGFFCGVCLSKLGNGPYSNFSYAGERETQKDAEERRTDWLLGNRLSLSEKLTYTLSVSIVELSPFARGFTEVDAVQAQLSVNLSAAAYCNEQQVRDKSSKERRSINKQTTQHLSRNDYASSLTGHPPHFISLYFPPCHIRETLH